MTHTLPLLRATNACAPFARRGAETVTVARFLQDAHTLARLLPGTGPIANLCQDRIRFATGFAAALIAGRTTLLPPSDSEAITISVLTPYKDVICLTDAEAPATLPSFRFPDLPPAPATAGIPEIPADAIAAILFTSGSTGQPQPHPRSWGLLVASAISAGAEIGAADLPGASLIGTVPHQHSYGLESLIMLAFQHSLVLHAERPFYPADIAALLATCPAPRILITTPVHLNLLVRETQILPPAELILSATAPLAPDLAVAAEEAFAAPLHEIYGCSEIGQLASRRPVHTQDWRCLEGFTLRQDGNATWACWGDIETRLADIIELRDSRHFRLLGRSADLVNVAGKRSSIGHLNAHLANIPGVQDAAFVTTGESEFGRTTLEAFVVAPGLTRAGILLALRALIDPVFLPRRLHFVHSLPRNPLGKLTAAALQSLLAESSEG